MTNIETSYLGMKLRSPIVVSASPITKSLELVKRSEHAGAGAIVMYSLFEEQCVNESRTLDHFLNHASDVHAEALTYFPELDNYALEPERYVDQLRRVKNAVQVPVIASLNGFTPGGWVEYAHELQQAGADALELNMYMVSTDISVTSTELEDMYVELVREIRAKIDIPLAVKLSPFYTSLPAFAKRVVDGGANALVLFNRFYQPDLDIENLEIVPALKLSTSEELRLPLRWIAILYGRIQCDFALTSGVHSATDALKAMVAGANVAMMTSELLAHGSHRIAEVLANMQTWMQEHEYESIEQMRGSMSQRAVADPHAFERANYIRALSTFDNRQMV